MLNLLSIRAAKIFPIFTLFRIIIDYMASRYLNVCKRLVLIVVSMFASS